MSNVCVTSAGRRVSLVSYFKKELGLLCGPQSKVVTTDLNPEISIACIHADVSEPIGYIRDEGYMDALLSICKKHDVSLLIPTIDPELIEYAKYRTEFKKEGIEIVISDLELVQSCRNKHKTTELFHQYGVQTPRHLDLQNLTFPFFVKPIDGSSSQNLFVVKSDEMLSDYLLDTSRFVHQEYLSPSEHDEYTIDIYYSKDSKIKAIVPRLRIAVRGGEINKGITRKNFLIDYVKDHFGKLKGARGVITLQVFVNKSSNEVFGIEINPRFGGGYPLSHLAGANYVNWLIKEYMHQEEISEFDEWRANTLLLRCDQEYVTSDFEYE